jgi:hypothetical protein
MLMAAGTVFARCVSFMLLSQARSTREEAAHVRCGIGS